MPHHIFSERVSLSLFVMIFILFLFSLYLSLSKRKSHFKEQNLQIGHAKTKSWLSDEKLECSETPFHLSGYYRSTSFHKKIFALRQSILHEKITSFTTIDRSIFTSSRRATNERTNDTLDQDGGLGEKGHFKIEKKSTRSIRSFYRGRRTEFWGGFGHGISCGVDLFTRMANFAQHF